MAVSVVLLLFFVLHGTDGTQIVGGRDSAPHSRPYMASLQVQGQHSCGGALVREDFVLTAAHCQIPIPYTVVLGGDTLEGNEASKQQFTAVRAFPHPRYDGRANDIMLLKLDRRAQLTQEVQLINLKRDRVNGGSRCIATGWGLISDQGPLASRLQEVDVNILSDQTCRNLWRPVPIVNSMICSVSNRNPQGACRGDSGGPLVCDGAAAGVVSFGGRRCGDPRTPVVYTRVSSFTEWIDNVINNN